MLLAFVRPTCELSNGRSAMPASEFVRSTWRAVRIREREAMPIRELQQRRL